MIVRIKGILEEIEIQENTRYADIMTQSGLTYRVILPARVSLGENGENVDIFTSLQVREESQVLYGFASQREREVFERLLTVSGVGPKIGIAILSLYTADEIVRMIIEGDHGALSKAPGIGPKGAKKIVLELGGILSLDEGEEREIEEKRILRELKDALNSLGFKGDEMKDMIKKGEKIVEENEDMSIETLLGKVLRE